MDSLQTISNDLVQSITEKEKKKSIPYDTYAKVIRIDGGTAWVHIPGGVDETPVALTVNAKAGDSVLVRVSGGNAWIVGNSSAPPTDDTKAGEAKGVADDAQVKAESAQETAESAEEIAKDASRAVKSTNQYFWHTETDTGAGAGAHITEVPQEDFVADPANGGGNLLAQSGGIRVRDGLTNLAEFGASGAVIGANDYGKSRVTVDNNGIALRWKPADPQYSEQVPFGVDLTGAMSLGESHTVTGSGSAAIGDACEASGEHSVAIGQGAAAVSYNQLAVGEFNKKDTANKYALIVGRGSDAGSRANVFTVDRQGNIDMVGKLQDFFSIVNLNVAVGQVAAHSQSNIGAVTVPTAGRPDGMTLVGIVGVTCNNYRVVPYNYYVNGAHSITCAVVNTTPNASAAGTTMTFKLLYAKMASA